MHIPKIEELNCPGRLGPLYLKKNYPEFYQYLLDNYTVTSSNKISEKLYQYYNSLSEPHRCPICGKYTPFLDFLQRGYQKFCSGKCSASSKEVINKRESTNIKKYGVKNACQNEDVKKKLVETYIQNNGGMGNASNTVREKQNRTMVDRYGVSCFSENKELLDKSIQTQIKRYGGVGLAAESIKEKVFNKIKEEYGGIGLASKIIKDKHDKTCLNKYGVINTSSLESVKEKTKSTKTNKYGDDSYNNRDKYKETCKERYGVDHPCKVRDNIDKIKSTKQERYGDPNYNNMVAYRETCKERYGVEWPILNEDVKGKFQKTMEDRYGTKYPAKSDEIKERIKQSNLEKYGVEWTCLLPEVQHPKGNKSTPNIKFAELLKENNIEYDTEYIIKNRSYDFKIGDILIEINPSATHNINWKPFSGKPITKDYHYEKTKLGNDNNFRVINVWDWDDVDKIIKSLLPRKTIYARNCELKEVSKKDIRNFLNEYHFQGSCNGQKIILGLYYNDELIQVMTFGKPRYDKYEWELLRLCTKSGIQVVGGSEKLFAQFINEYNPTSIISYCDNSKFKGDVYERLGFNMMSYSKPSKHWYNIKTKVHVTNNLLNQRGFDQLFGTNYGEENSNEDLMFKRGFIEIFDAGQSVWVWSKK